MGTEWWDLFISSLSKALHHRWEAAVPSTVLVNHLSKCSSIKICGWIIGLSDPPPGTPRVSFCSSGWVSGSALSALVHDYPHLSANTGLVRISNRDKYKWALVVFIWILQSIWDDKNNNSHLLTFGFTTYSGWKLRIFLVVKQKHDVWNELNKRNSVNWLHFIAKRPIVNIHTPKIQLEELFGVRGHLNI